jgi:predicted enzyme related to lactoylglutathione lyase
MRRTPQSYRNGELVIVIDCSDLARPARFWAGVLGYKPCPAGSPTYLSLIPGDGRGIEVLLQRTGDDKHQKNRLHLDLRTASLEEEVERILGLGASLLTDHPVIEHGWRWQILADPDGNEFCVLQPPADSPATS